MCVRASKCFCIVMMIGLMAIGGCAEPDLECDNCSEVDASLPPDGDTDEDTDSGGDDNTDAGGAGDAGDSDPDAATAAEWTEALAPGGGGSILELTFAGNTGWMVTATSASNRLWTTTTSGANWTEHNVEAEAIIDVGVAADGSVWLVSDYTADTEIWTSDDGATFAPAANEPTGSFEAVGLIDSNTAVVLSNIGSDLYTTDDGAESWALHEPGSDLAGANFLWVDGDTIVVAGGVAYENDGSGANLAISRDFGNAWTFHLFQNKAHDFMGGMLEAVYLSEAGDIWAAGEHRQLFVVPADNPEYRQIEDIPDELGDFRAITGRGDYLAVAADWENPAGPDGVAIYESTDGGETWSIAFRTDCNCRASGAVAEPDGPLWIYGTGGLLIAYE